MWIKDDKEIRPGFPGPDERLRLAKRNALLLGCSGVGIFLFVAAAIVVRHCF